MGATGGGGGQTEPGVAGCARTVCRQSEREAACVRTTRTIGVCSPFAGFMDNNLACKNVSTLKQS